MVWDIIRVRVTEHNGISAIALNNVNLQLQLLVYGSLLRLQITFGNLKPFYSSLTPLTQSNTNMKVATTSLDQKTYQQQHKNPIK
jgi:hypothetical protein